MNVVTRGRSHIGTGLCRGMTYQSRPSLMVPLIRWAATAGPSHTGQGRLWHLAFGIPLVIPPGTGGGCVYAGPFQPSEYNVTLGPVGILPRGPNDGLGYNPRCLKRDFSKLWTSFNKPTDVLSLLTKCTDVGCFNSHIDAVPSVHAGGHFGMGGEPGADPYTSPGDPAFWLHHASIDRMWTIWQTLDPDARLNQTSGTGTAFNSKFSIYQIALFNYC